MIKIKDRNVVIAFAVIPIVIVFITYFFTGISDYSLQLPILISAIIGLLVIIWLSCILYFIIRSMLWVVKKLKGNEMKSEPSEEKSVVDKNGKKKGIYSDFWILWWKIDQEVLDRQVDKYDTLKITQSARGLSFLLCILTFILGFYVYAKSPSLWLMVITTIPIPVLGFLVFRGQQWASVILMIWWTVERFFAAYKQIFISSRANDIIPVIGMVGIFVLIFWSLYMHAFYVALKVENLRRKDKSLIPDKVA